MFSCFAGRLLIGAVFLPGFIATAQDTLAVSLDKVFLLAEQASSQIRMGQLRSERAEAVMGERRNAMLPTAEFSASAGYLSNVGVIGMGTMPSGFYDMPHFSNSYALQANLVVYGGGRKRTDIGIAALERDMAALDAVRDRQDVRLILAGYHLDLYQLYQQREVYNFTIDMSRALLQKIANRYESGAALKSDKIRNELLVSSFELALTRVEDRIAITNYNLIILLNLPASTIVKPDGLNEMDAGVQQLLLVANNTSLETVALRNNPELNKALAVISIADKRLQQVRSTLLPEVSVFASASMARPYTFDIPAKDIYANTNIIGLRLNLPVSSLYLFGKKRDIAQKDIAIASLSAELAEQALKREVNSRTILLRQSIAQLETLYKQQELAGENYRRITDSYMEQLALNTEVMDATSQKLDADLRISQAMAEILFNYYQLRKALGNL